MKEKIIFKEVQNSSWLKILFWFLAIGHAAVVLVKWEESLQFIFLGLSLLFAVIAIIFSKLSLTLTTKELFVSFGLNVFKRTIPVKEIDFSSVKIEDAPLLYGIGLRITPKGRLYNLRPGKAIWLKSNQNKTIFVVTDKAEKWKEEILKLR
ncbi:hypothetical protein [Mesonia maritima]|uniref:PH domain-containing protein n=1 Tax=Mesonia maritima TaxID=1793873 RepID=A0ABU1K5L7_9FLAO|nr:hypothetical protein [Mesonia maritima]MDR6300908.1 hypothetical protein [Mesonia maritima]